MLQLPTRPVRQHAGAGVFEIGCLKRPYASSRQQLWDDCNSDARPLTKLALPPLLLGWAGIAFMTSASEASADTPETLPPFAIAARETFDMFGVPAGVRPGAAILNKLQISATVRGDELGFAGWSIHGQMFRSDGKSLSRRMGDIQTADNIEAVRVTRLFEAYLAKMWTMGKGSIAVRLGLIDLNSQFDSIDPASLMLNSSHGIGPDLSRSGRNGPSIYPVTAVGSTVTWVNSQGWTIRAGLFDGVAGSPSATRTCGRETEAQ